MLHSRHQKWHNTISLKDTLYKDGIVHVYVWLSKVASILAFLQTVSVLKQLFLKRKSFLPLKPLQLSELYSHLSLINEQLLNNKRRKEEQQSAYALKREHEKKELLAQPPEKLPNRMCGLVGVCMELLKLPSTLPGQVQQGALGGSLWGATECGFCQE